MKRKVVRIDEEKCNGCGLCIPACAEGAIELVDGKARLVDDQYCDGLGDCLGECPQDAITIVEREAEPFDPEAVEERIAQLNGDEQQSAAGSRAESSTSVHDGGVDNGAHGCPGMQARSLDAQGRGEERTDPASSSAAPSLSRSELNQWPIQMELLPTQAPFYQDAQLLLAADCVPFAHPGFHSNFLEGKTLIIGCPKLDNAENYCDKLAAILKHNDIGSLHVIHMEVPCCSALHRLAELAVDASGSELEIHTTIISIDGSINRSQHVSQS